MNLRQVSSLIFSDIYHCNLRNAAFAFLELVQDPVENWPFKKKKKARTGKLQKLSPNLIFVQLWNSDDKLWTFHKHLS